MNKAGFAAIIGRPNAGKSTLLNALLGEKIAMVSQKANATRRRLNAIVMHGEDQLIFVDTPGLHEKERQLHRFMLEEALKAIGDCDVIVYLAPAADSVKHYERFLELSGGKKHIIALSKIDQVSQGELLKRISEYNAFSERFEALIPVSVTKSIGLEDLKETIAKALPESPYLFDPEDLTDERLRDIFKEFIRESIFEKVSDEIPYGTDVVIDKIDESDAIDHIRATIIVEKESQKGIMIGKGGTTIKRIGKLARGKIEKLSGRKAFLDLFVSVKPNWTNDRKSLEELGYIT